jgi:CubicO group peptidase (beta-lactamase class C family)
MKGTLGDYGWLGYLGTSFWIDPEQKIIGIVLSQRPYDGYKLTQDVKNILYTQK